MFLGLMKKADNQAGSFVKTVQKDDKTGIFPYNIGYYAVIVVMCAQSCEQEADIWIVSLIPGT